MRPDTKTARQSYRPSKTGHIFNDEQSYSRKFKQIDSLLVQTNQRPAHYELDQSNTSKLSQTDTRQIHNTDKTDIDTD